jgi:hypothetical protein
VLLRIEHPLANELLIAIAAEESMESRARSLAIREVGSRKLAEASPIMESVFDTEATNFLIRKDALLVILEIDEPRGIAILKNKMPQRTSDLGMYTFMNSLREKHNVQ